MNPAIAQMLQRYKCVNAADYENALKEIIQEIALLGLWRAKFYEHAAFYGGTALRILYGLDRFSEDLDFSLLHTVKNFNVEPYLKAIQTELKSFGFSVNVEKRQKNIDTAIESAFIKAGTQEHFFMIEAPQGIANHIQKQALLSIKFEVDTQPPGEFQTEVLNLLQPIPFSVRSYQKPDLFAGKIHAVLQRQWKFRVKGRDFYDFVWYIARDVPIRLRHIEERLRQSNAWSEKTMKGEDLIPLLQNKFETLDINAAKKDVIPFLRDPSSVDLWSKDFFLSLLSRLKFC